MGLKAPGTILAADWILPIASPPVAGGGLLIEDGVVRDLGRLDEVRARNPHAAETRLTPGVLMPGLVNTHTHLELAALERLPAPTGFSSWLARLVAAKDRLAPAAVRAAAARAARELKAAGTAHVADVFNLYSAAAALAAAGVTATLFHELLGTDAALLDVVAPHPAVAPHPRNAAQPEARVLPACHAPFSTGRDLLRQCARRAADTAAPWTMHLAESEDETELLLAGTGPLAGFLRGRGVPAAAIPRPGARPIAYVDELGCLDERLIAVHLVQASRAEIALLAHRGVRPCLCPSSNLHLVGKLPPIADMLAAGLRPALGTDSLASGRSLNLFGEMEILLDRGINAAMILKMATLNGADALRLSGDFGRIVKGKRPSLIHVAFDEPAGDSSRAAMAAIRGGARGRIAWIAEPAAPAAGRGGAAAAEERGPQRR